MSEAMFYTWKKKYAHLGVSELRRLASLAAVIVVQTVSKEIGSDLE